MDDATMIDMHEDLVRILKEINKEAPKIKEMYSSFQKELKEKNTILNNAIANAKTEINRAEISGTKNISELSTTRKQQIDACLKELEEVVKRAEDLQETLGISVDSIQEFEERIEDFETDIESLKKEVKKQKSLYKSLEERVSSLEENISAEDPDEEDDEDSNVEIDYDEILPAFKIYNKYKDSVNPIIIEKPTYRGDFCFMIKEINSVTRRFTGNYYRNGKIYKRNSTFPYDADCRMYHGNTINILLDRMNEMLKKWE